MTTPLSTLLTELLTDPDGRAALGDDPAGVLADNGWGDLSPRDMGDALRLVTASGPAAAAHAGSDLPDQPTTWAEVLDPVLEATAELESWEPDVGPALVAGSIEPETFDFAPAPLVGVDPELTPDAHDDPFLSSDGDDSAAVADAAPADGSTASDDDIDLTFGDDSAPADDTPHESEVEIELEEAPFVSQADALGSAGDWSIDELDAPAVEESFVELDDEDAPDLGDGSWGDLDNDLD